MVSTSHNAERIESLVAPRLAQIARAYPHLVQHPRAAGYAFAFDLPTPALHDAFIGQRFWRGAVVFGAGTRTARYRLSDSYHAREIDLLFETTALAVVARCAPGQEGARVGGRRGRRGGAPGATEAARAALPPGAAWRGDGVPAGDPRHRVPGLRAGAANAAGRDPRGDRRRRGRAARGREPGARRRRQLAAGRLRDRRAARGLQGRRGPRRRSDARPAQHAVLACRSRGAAVPGTPASAAAQGGAAATRGRAQTPTARRATATCRAATASAAPPR